MEIPASIRAERDMWWDLTSFVYDNDEEAAERLDKYRKASVAETGTDTVETEPVEGTSAELGQEKEGGAMSITAVFIEGKE